MTADTPTPDAGDLVERLRHEARAAEFYRDGKPSEESRLYDEAAAEIARLRSLDTGGLREAAEEVDARRYPMLRQMGDGSELVGDWVPRSTIHRLLASLASTDSGESEPAKVEVWMCHGELFDGHPPRHGTGRADKRGDEIECGPPQHLGTVTLRAEHEGGEG